MLKNKTHRLRRMSSAALIGLAIYGSSMSPAWASELRHSKKQEGVRIERSEKVNKTGEVIVGEGTVKSVGQNMLVVTRKKDGQDFSVTLDARTKVFQGFGKKITADQISVGHRVFVKGSVLNGDGSSIAARVIRDMSLKVRLSKE